MRELWIYLRCVYHNEVTYCTFLLGVNAFGLTPIAADFGMLWVSVLVLIGCVSFGAFILSGAALNTFYSYAVTAAAIGSGTTAPLALSPDMKPAERTGAVLACDDHFYAYVAA